MAINYLSSIDLNQNELKRARIENIGGTSGVPGVSGQLIYDTTGAGGLYVSDGTNWKAVGKYDNLNLTALSGTNNGALRLMEDTTVLDTITFQATIGQGISINAAGSAININHADTSSVANSDNSNGVVLQDITFDGFGHVQTIGTTDLDGRYLQSVSGGEGVVITGTDSNIINVRYQESGSGVLNNIIQEAPTSGSLAASSEILVNKAGSGISYAAKVSLNAIPLNFSAAATGDIDLGGNKIENVGTPTASTDAATKSYVDNAIVGSLSYQSAYDASIAPPTGTGVKQGYVYAVTVAGNGAGFFDIILRPGDMIIAQQDNPTSQAHWTEIQSNVDYATAGTSSTATRGLASFNSDNFIVNSTGHVSGKSANTTTAGLARVTAADGLEVDSVSNGNFTISLDESTGGNPLSKSVSLDGTNSNITRQENGGLSVFALTITSGFFGSNVAPKDLIVQIQETSSGNVVFTEIEKSASTLNIRFNGSITNGDYTALLMRAN